MRLTSTLLRAFAVVAASALTGCTTVVAGSAISAERVDDTGCERVSAPLVSIEQNGADEPRLRIPQPPGWQRKTMLDSKLVRYAQVNTDLTKNRFAPNAVVTFEALHSTVDVQRAFDEEKAGIERVLGVTDLVAEPTTLCGYRAETVTYTAPPMGAIPERPAVLLLVADRFGGDTLYVAGVTVQSTEPDNPTYLRDKQAILTGFQMLPPG